jgi:hypothetical protein
VHAHLYWFQALDSDPVRANIALGYIARPSQVDSMLRRMYPEQNRQRLRDFNAIVNAHERLAVPILKEFEKWLEDELATGRILLKNII